MPPGVLPVPPMPVPQGSSALSGHPGWSIAVLDRDYILQRMIPGLLESSFGSAGAGEYEAIVVSNVTGMVWHATPGVDSEHGFDHPDATVPLLTLATEGARRAAVPRPPDPPPGAPVRAPWMLMVRSQSGSVDQAVAASRYRHLAISGALMLLMATALVVLWISVRRARQLSQRQLEFVASVSHELRTPLAVIRSAGENLADGIVSNGESVQRYGALVRDEGRRLSGMVEQTLRFAGTPSGRAKYNMRETKVAAVIESAVESQCHTIEASNCRLEVRVDAGLPLILADAAALSHAVGNLLANAAKHGAGGGWIGVRASRSRDGEVSIEVSDQGPGIPPQEIRHIFEPFYRGRQATDAQVPGTGLGLALVKGVAEAHQGRVSVRSRRGQGAHFTLSLPAASESKMGGSEDEQTHSDRGG
jgi:signal transduction histidine kinase